MQFKLLTPDELIYSGDADLVGGRTEQGSFSILQRHIPAVMELEPALLKVKAGDETRRFVVHGGFLFKERDETVKVMTRSAEAYEDIDVSRLNERIGELEEKLAEAGADGESDEMELELERARTTVDLVENE